MSTTIITKKELTIPAGVIAQVAEVIIENEIVHEIVASDIDDDTITLEVEYTKDEREIIHEIEDIISDFEEDAEEEDEEEDNDDRRKKDK
jgi:hypothetical protein